MPVVERTSHWVPDPNEQPPLRHITVAELLEEAAAKWPEREAIVYSAYADLGIAARWSFQELRERARDVARAMVASGLERGERVGIWATNRPEWLLVQFGAAYAGVVFVPMNPLYRSSEVAYVLGKAGASACFVEPENRGASLWAILADAAADLPSLRERVALGDASGLDGPGLGEWVEAGRGVSDAQLDRRRAEIHPVMATLGAVATGSAQLPTLTFDAARIVTTVDAEAASSLGAVPTMLIALEEEVDRSGGSLESLEIVVTGGSPVPVDVERRWIERFGVRFTITYGLTESSPVITQSLPDDPEHLQIATCGRALPHVEVDVVDPVTRTPVRIGEQGELRTRGTMVMSGYWDDEVATRGVIEEGGWLRSGDLARMDEEGYVSITGRAKEMIIRGGENIYPAEVEDALRGLPAVLDVSVVGVPDERYGEQAAAFVRLAEGASLAEDEMREQLASRVARYKIPRYLVVVEDFPVTPSGKVQKYKLREQFVAGQH